MLTLDSRAWLICALLALVLGVGSFVGGCVHGQGLADGRAAKTTVLVQQADAVRVERVAEATQSAAVQSTREQVRVITKFQPIEREVIRYVQTPAAAELCLDADGLRIWRAANRGEFDDAAAEPAGHDALRGADPAAGERRPGGPAGEPRGNGQGPAQLRGEAGGAGATHPGSAPGADRTLNIIEGSGQ